MSAFLQEHARPLIGSALLHVGIAAAVIVATWFSVAPQRVQPAAIEAYLAPAPRDHVGVRPEPTPAAEVAAEAPPSPPPAEIAKSEPLQPPAPDPAVVARQKAAELLRVEHAAQLKADAANKKALEHNAKLKAAADAKRVAAEQAQQIGAQQ